MALALGYFDRARTRRAKHTQVLSYFVKILPGPARVASELRYRKVRSSKIGAAHASRHEATPPSCAKRRS
jgi:hypothetical protein